MLSSRCRIRLFAGALLSLLAVASVNAGMIDVSKYPKGLTQLSDADRAWSQKNMVHGPIAIRANQLAVNRISAAAPRSGGAAPAPLAAASIAPMGAEISPVATAAAAAGTFGYSAAALPLSVDNSTLPFFPPIADQGALGSCAAFSTTWYLMTHMTGLARGWTDKSHIFSPKLTYNVNNGGRDLGTNIDMNIRLLCEAGALDIAQYPYDGTKSSDTNWLSWPSTLAQWTTALGNKALTSGVISGIDVDSSKFLSVKQLLVNGYVLNFGTFVGSWAITTTANDPATVGDDAYAGQFICKSVAPTLDGAHAMTIVGYNDEIWTDINGNGFVDKGEKGAFKIANSWGTGAWNNGFVWLAYDAIYGRSKVAGVEGGRDACFFENSSVYWLQARSSYTPRMTAVARISTALRGKFSLRLGYGSSSTAAPEYLWTPAVFQSVGSVDCSFAGTTTATEATFVFDLTDVVEKKSVDIGVTKKWYQLTQGYLGTPVADVKEFRINDQQGSGGVGSLLVPRPVSYMPDTLALTYARANGSVNYAPIVSVGSDKNLDLATASTITAAGTVIDDLLPSGATRTTQWSTISGPGTLTYATPSQLSTTVSATVPGTYTVGLSAFDGQLSASDNFTLAVGRLRLDGALNQPNCNAMRLALKGNLAALACNDGWLRTYSVQNPAAPTLLGAVQSNALHEVVMSGTRAYGISSMFDGVFFAYDLSNPSAPVVTAQVSMPNHDYGSLRSLVVTNAAAYVASARTGIRVFDLSSPATPVLANTVTTRGLQRSLATDGRYLYSTDWDSLRVRIYSLANPLYPYEVNSFPVSSFPQQIEVQGGYLYVRYDAGVIAVYALSNPATAPTLVSTIPAAAKIFSLSGNLLFAGTAQGITVYDVTSKTAPVLVSSSLIFEDSMMVRDIVVDSAKVALGVGGYWPTTTGGFRMFTSRCANTAPFVSAGVSFGATAGIQTYLTGTASDDGKPGALSVNWSKKSGPGTVSFVNASQATTGATFSAAGTYVVRLSATDGALTSADSITVTVIAAPVDTFMIFTSLKMDTVVSGSSYPAWIATKVYYANDTVSYNGHVWRAQWWTQNEIPGSVQWGAWADLGVGGGATTISAHGTMSPFGNVRAARGSTKVFTMIPDSGYVVDSVIVNSAFVGALTSYSFTNVQGNGTIYARFKKGTAVYSVTASAGTGGTITPSGVSTVSAGGTLSYSITANTGYAIDSLIVDGSNKGALATYSFSAVNANHTIRAVFKVKPVKTFTITASAGTGGSITPSGSVTVDTNTAKTFAIAANSGYAIDSLIVDGSNKGALATYSFSAVNANHTIRAVFKVKPVKTFTITASAGTGGSITPSGSVTVDTNAAKSFVVKASAGYAVDSLSIDGVKIKGDTLYTFSAVKANHTIVATFKVQGSNICTGVPAWDANTPWTSYTVGMRRVNANKLFECINVAYSFYEPSGPYGSYGWKLIGACN